MTPPPLGGNDFGEDALIEQPAIALFRSLGWGYVNCFHEFEQGGGSPLGRETPQEVILAQRLHAVLKKFNPDLPSEALMLAIEELTRDRSAMSAVNANREVYRLFKDGVKVTVRQPDGSQITEIVRVIDWREPSKNDFFLASQFWVTGEMYRRRCDLVCFVNGIPLVFLELKAAHKRLEDAYNNNLRDYRTAIPQLFRYNGLIILSNGSLSRIGSSTASWEHFNAWTKINDEGEEGVISLETMIRGTCAPSHLLDLVENFTVFEEAKSGTVKNVGKAHQYFGVNRVINGLRQLTTNKGRLGVFWHTQGSGKSISMIFFAQKVLRTIPGNWTFVIVTDRQELDDQIYKNFLACGAVTEKQAQATSGEDLKRLLTEDHRYVFTLIQKFRTDQGASYPKISDRSDIIVITDEAHRSQYDTFALNMRTALPNAAFIGFTGTPLMMGEEKTKEVFGDYVSVYNFKQSVDDGATVPLFYENRIPELQLTNQDLNEDMEQLLDTAALDAEQEKKLEREFAREYHLITRDDRMETIAKDLVSHFMGRGYHGKAMVVCIDKATAVRMYDKVQTHWKAFLKDLNAQLKSVGAEQKEALEKKIAYMIQTDMAVVVSQSQNEIEEMKKKGLNIEPHRRRMVSEDLDTKFKNPDDPFRIVFVCAMWMTGFDVPCCSTIYLDKPMRNHTLMQTIARANRVFRDKVNGLIVDYVGVFRSLQKALAIYAAPRQGEPTDGVTPIQSKAALVEILRRAMSEAVALCAKRGVDPATIQAATGFERVKCLDDAVEALVVNDEAKRKYLMLAGNVAKLYRAILPDAAAGEFAPLAILLAVLAEKIRSLSPPTDISEIMGAVEQLLDESIAPVGYVIRGAKEGEQGKFVDLTAIDFEKLKATFATSRKRTEAEKLRGMIALKLKTMVERNRSRVDYLDKFQRLIDEYNAGSKNIEAFFNDLVTFAQTLNEEEKRGIAENLSEEELALFDILTKPDPTLSKPEEKKVKKVAKELLEILKNEKLVLDWRKRQQTRAAVRLCIEKCLDQLPTTYTPELFQQKCDLTYQHIYDAYFGQGRSIYHPAA